MDFQIHLAAPTPLFAPIYLAKRLNRDDVFSDIRLVYDERKHPFRQEPVDPLIHRLLLQNNSSGEAKILFVVCDPLRAIIPKTSGCDEPLVVSGLVQNMFFWLVNDGHFIASQRRLPQAFRRILVTPKHMTGYAVALYDLVHNCGVADVEQADRLLYTDTVPGFEAVQWQHFQSARGPGEQGFAYLTTNIFEYFEHRRSIRREYHSVPQFQDCIMSGLVTNKRIHQEHHDKSNDALGGIRQAIEEIYEDPHRAAYALQGYADERVRFDNYALTRDTLEYLANSRAFPRHGFIYPHQVMKSRAIRKAAESVIHGADDTVRFDDIDSVKDYFVLREETVDAVPPAPAVRHAEWLSSSLQDQLSCNQELRHEISKRIHAGLVISSVLLALELTITAAEALEKRHPVYEYVKYVARLLETLGLLAPIWHDSFACFFGAKRLLLKYRETRNIFGVTFICLVLLMTIVVVRIDLTGHSLLDKVIGSLLTFVLGGVIVGLCIAWWQSNTNSPEFERWKRAQQDRRMASQIRKQIARSSVPTAHPKLDPVEDTQ
jgi:hypothetical protein